MNKTTYLAHYGRKGMKWGKHVFDDYYSDLKESARESKGYSKEAMRVTKDIAEVRRAQRGDKKALSNVKAKAEINRANKNLRKRKLAAASKKKSSSEHREVGAKFVAKYLRRK